MASNGSVDKLIMFGFVITRPMTALLANDEFRSSFCFRREICTYKEASSRSFSPSSFSLARICSNGSNETRGPVK